jgi:hypothetical protein
MKTHVITLSKSFMKGHPREGEPTDFAAKFLSGEKKHTLRGNTEYWSKKIQEVMDGKAILSVRQWTGKPYASKQETLKDLTATDGVGFQIVLLDAEFSCFQTKPGHYNCYPNISTISFNDGLLIDDFREWFGLVEPTPSRLEHVCAIIIHFTNFRY